jgi:molybdopterin/thiamine biosynthesis adenylyltransferase
MHTTTIPTCHPAADLERSSALVIGVGGLGAPAAAALARAGVGRLRLVDPDVVETSNLPRQPLYDDGDVGAPKVTAAARRLQALHAGVRVEPVRERFDGDLALLRDVDVVIDGTDTVATKFVVNDATVAAGVPLVHAGAIGFRAQLLTVLPGESACYRCVFEEPPPADEVASCQEAGVLGPTVVLAGTLQAAEAVRLLRGERAQFANRLLTIDTKAGTWRSVPVGRHSACVTCGVPSGAERRSATP